MKDVIILIVLVLVLASAITYIVKSKKNPNKCIGCPSGANCPYKNGNCPSEDK